MNGGERSWWDRNWHWVAGYGCLLPLLLFGGCVAFTMFLVRSGTEPYEIAAETVTYHPVLIESLGEPIDAEWSGSMQISVKSGETRFDLGVEGPRGSGIVDVVARNTNGEWEFIEMVARIEGEDEAIDLLDGQESPADLEGVQ